MPSGKRTGLAIHPLTPDRWDDFETLFGKSGGCAGCFCMWPRLSPAEWLAKKPVDDSPVWSVTCFFVRRDWRRRGVTAALLAETPRFVAGSGGRMVEGYPFDVAKEQVPAFVHYGLLGAFRRAGFQEVARCSKHRPIDRKKAAAR